MSQLELFAGKEEYLAQDFIEIDEVADVANALGIFFKCREYDQKHIPNIIIQGEQLSGKTHLVRFLAQKYKLNIIDLTSDIDLVDFFEEGECYIFEDVDETNNDELLLNIINLAKESKAFLIFTLKNEIKTKIKDFDSRLKNFFIKCKIKPLSEDSINQLAVGYLSRNQIKATNKAVKEIIASKWRRVI